MKIRAYSFWSSSQKVQITAVIVSLLGAHIRVVMYAIFTIGYFILSAFLVIKQKVNSFDQVVVIFRTNFVVNVQYIQFYIRILRLYNIRLFARYSLDFRVLVWKMYIPQDLVVYQLRFLFL